VVAFFVGLVVIHWLLRYISTHNFRPFVVYRLVLAAVVAVLLLTGVLDAVPDAT
jgi:undecaprenyl-diphosphatase